MNIEIILPDDSIFEFQPGLQTGYKEPLLRGSTAIHGRTSFAAIAMQKLSGVNYFIRLSAGKFLNRISAGGWKE